MKLSLLFQFSGVFGGSKFGKANRSQDLDRLNGQPNLDKCPSEPTTLATIFSRVTNHLGSSVLLNLLLEHEGDKHLIISPLAVSSQLAFLHEGAGSSSRYQIEKAAQLPPQGSLHAISDLKERFQCVSGGMINIQNAIFIDKSFKVKPEYVGLLRASKAGIFKSDFASDPEMSRAVINEYAKFNTKLEGDILAPGSIEQSTSLVMLSTVSLNLEWAIKFNPEKTNLGGFLLPNGKTKMVPFMNLNYVFPNIISCHENSQVSRCHNDKLVPSMVDIPTSDPRLTMLIIKPHKQLKIGMILSMMPKWLPYWRHLLSQRESFTNINLKMPKVHMSSGVDITNALFGLGVEDVFESFRANLTRISDQPGLAASNSYAYASLKWDETGTQADMGQLTSFLKFNRNAVDDVKDVIFPIDRSFIFLLSDRVSQSTLFTGIVNDPRDY